MYEVDITGRIDLVQSGHAIGLCQGTFRQTEGLTSVPIAGAPLRWRHLLGWHPASNAATFSGAALAHAVAAYTESAQRNVRYAQWLKEHPSFGPHR